MTVTNKQILILVEHVARELDIACLIKYLVEKEGDISVTIVSIPYFDKSGKENINPDVIAVPFCYSVGTFLKSQLCRYPNARVINLAYEQIFQNIADNMKSPKDEFARQNVLHIAWSTMYRDYLVRYGVNANNIILNGNLSYMLYNKPYNKYFLTRHDLSERYGIDPSKKWVLIPENYGAAFYSDNILKEKISLGISPEDVVKYKDFAQRSLHEVITWCLIAASTIDDIEIIFRPRPATSINQMIVVFREINPEIPNRIHIIKDLSVREWIMASDCVLSSYSTTLIEAAIAKKPISMLMPLVFPEYLLADWYEMVPKIKNFNDFLTVITNPSADTGNALHDWATDTMIGKSDPLRNVADILIKEIYDPSIRSAVSLDFHESRRRSNLIPPGLMNLLNKVGICVKRPNEDIYEKDFFSERDVLKKVEHWKHILGYLC